MLTLWNQAPALCIVHGDEDFRRDGFGSRPMNKNDCLWAIQANIICLLVFLIGMAALAEHPAWFR
jgi:hypothetical protein